MFRCWNSDCWRDSRFVRALGLLGVKIIEHAHDLKFLWCKRCANVIVVFLSFNEDLFCSLPLVVQNENLDELVAVFLQVVLVNSHFPTEIAVVLLLVVLGFSLRQICFLLRLFRCLFAVIRLFFSCFYSFNLSSFDFRIFLIICGDFDLALVNLVLNHFCTGLNLDVVHKFVLVRFRSDRGDRENLFNAFLCNRVVSPGQFGAFKWILEIKILVLIKEKVNRILIATVVLDLFLRFLRFFRNSSVVIELALVLNALFKLFWESVDYCLDLGMVHLPPSDMCVHVRDQLSFTWRFHFRRRDFKPSSV